MYVSYYISLLFLLIVKSAPTHSIFSYRYNILGLFFPTYNEIFNVMNREWVWLNATQKLSSFIVF